MEVKFSATLTRGFFRDLKIPRFRCTGTGDHVFPYISMFFHIMVMTSHCATRYPSCFFRVHRKQQSMYSCLWVWVRENYPYTENGYLNWGLFATSRKTNWDWGYWQVKPTLKKYQTCVGLDIQLETVQGQFLTPEKTSGFLVVYQFPLPPSCLLCSSNNTRGIIILKSAVLETEQ